MLHNYVYLNQYTCIYAKIVHEIVELALKVVLTFLETLCIHDIHHEC